MLSNETRSHHKTYLVKHDHEYDNGSHDPEPTGGISPPHSDAPRMDATDSDGFSHKSFYSSQRLQITKHELHRWLLGDK